MTAEAGQRIDKWLWHARFARTRTAAQALAKSGRVRVNKVRNVSASQLLKVGDVLTLSLESGVKVVRVLGTAERRGPAQEARLLYDEEMSIPARRPAAPPHAAPSHRPGKRDRRRLMELKRAPDG